MEITDRKFLDTKTNTVHAATITFLEDNPIFSWFGGSREGAEDVAIYVQYEDDSFSIGSNDRMPRWNPILFNYDEEIYLATKQGTFCDRWQTMISKIDTVETTYGHTIGHS